jgi:G3E family GTPase
MKDMANTVYRAKGFLNFKNYPLTTLYQKVGSFESYVDGGTWGVSTPRTELVLIGVSSQFDREAITRSLDACTA